MQTVNIPAKWVIPFAQGDSGKVEVPATTTDPTRASLLLGFPPLTMQPPEAGGVPPQGEDFNGAMNQIARIAWWKMGGGAFPYDATFATDPNVNGYPQGANVASVDYSGTWLSLVDNNTVDPDTVGTGWAPLSTYGVTALTGQTGGTATLTPAQAMKRVITVAGALTSNLTIIVPAWTYDWSVTNATTGAFTVTVKPAAGAGVLIPQNGLPAAVRGDGTNVLSLNAAGRLINVQTFATAGTFTYTPTPGTNSVIVDAIGGGAGSPGTPATNSTTSAQLGGGGGGSAARVRITSGFSGASVTVGAGGAAGANGTGAGNGGTTSFGAFVSCPGGVATSAITFASTVTTNLAIGGAGGALPTGSGGTFLETLAGNQGLPGITAPAGTSGGAGGSAGNGGGGGAARGAQSGQTCNAGVSPGSAAGGIAAIPSASANAGAPGAPGQIVVYEYA